MSELAQRLPADVLLVLAGRTFPNWGRRWPGWLTQAKIEELKPMTEDAMRELVYRYYTLQHEPVRHKQMHSRAAAYFERQLKTVKGEEATELTLEYLYHNVHAELGSYLLELGDLYKRQGRWSDAFANLERAQRLYEKIGDTYGLVLTSDRLKCYSLDRGMWKEGFKMQQRGLQEVANLTDDHRN